MPMEEQLLELTAVLPLHERRNQLQSAADDLLAALPTLIKSRHLNMPEALAWARLLPCLTKDDGLLLVVALLVKSHYPSWEWKQCVKLAALLMRDAWGVQPATERVESGLMAMLFSESEKKLINSKLPPDLVGKIFFEDYLVQGFPRIVENIMKKVAFTHEVRVYRYYWKAIYRALADHELSRYRHEFTSHTSFVTFMCDHLFNTWKADISQLTDTSIRDLFKKSEWFDTYKKQPLPTKETPLTTGSGACYPGYYHTPWRDYEAVYIKEKEEGGNYEKHFKDINTVRAMTDIATYFTHWLDDGLPDPTTYELRK